MRDEIERQTFALKAAKHFAENPRHMSFSDEEPDLAPGSWLALRWGLGNDCVLVLRIGDEMPVNYGQLITHPPERPTP